VTASLQYTTRGTATSASSGGVATFNINGVVVSCQVARDLTVASGDVCAIVQVGGIWVAVARLYSAAPVAADYPGVPAPKPSSVSGVLTCSPVETRSYRGSAWRTDTDDIVQGIQGSAGNSTGCAFYGTKPASLTGATVTGATVRIRRPNRSGIATALPLTLALVTETIRPAGAPTLTLTAAGPSVAWGQETVHTLTTSWAQAMVNGTAGGLAVFDSDGDPFVVLSGRGDYGPAFTMMISWTR
jgi:hypothetical protein